MFSYKAIKPIIACNSITNPSLFARFLNFLNTEHQSRKWHTSFLNIWYDSVDIRHADLPDSEQML